MCSDHQVWLDIDIELAAVAPAPAAAAGVAVAPAVAAVTHAMGVSPLNARKNLHALLPGSAAVPACDVLYAVCAVLSRPATSVADQVRAVAHAAAQSADIVVWHLTRCLRTARPETGSHRTPARHAAAETAKAWLSLILSCCAVLC